MLRIVNASPNAAPVVAAYEQVLVGFRCGLGTDAAQLLHPNNASLFGWLVSDGDTPFARMRVWAHVSPRHATLARSTATACLEVLLQWSAPGAPGPIEGVHPATLPLATAAEAAHAALEMLVAAVDTCAMAAEGATTAANQDTLVAEQLERHLELRLGDSTPHLAQVDVTEWPETSTWAELVLGIWSLDSIAGTSATQSWRRALFVDRLNDRLDALATVRTGRGPALER